MRHSRRLPIVVVTFLILMCPSAQLVKSSPYSVVVSTKSDAYVAGDDVEISGFVRDQGNESISTFVVITVLTPENTTLSMSLTHSDSHGFFFTLFSLPSDASLGTYIVTATTEGPAAAHTAFKVILNTITCLVNSSFTYPAMSVLIQGSIYPARSVELLLQVSRDFRIWQDIAYVYSNSSGHYSFDWVAPNEPGNYTIMATYDGTNSSLASLKVIVKGSTSLSLSPSSYAIQLGQTVRLQGMLNSTSRNATVTIRYSNPEGASFDHEVQADPEGRFEDSFKPDIGTWTISASWPGDALNQRADSLEVKLVVSSPPPTILLLSIVAIEDIIVLGILTRQYVKRRRALRH